jgi:hypothetical protein
MTMLVAAGDALAQTEPPSIAAADRAFEQGRHDEALALYDKVLESDPSNAQALVRSGMLLSWKDKHVAAIERYDRALALNPDNYKAQLERAKVLSWSRQFDKAADAFATIAEKNPDDREARIGLARVYSWGGNQPRARAEYMKLVEANPADAGALLGVAQTYAWGGDSLAALEWYDKALLAEPGKMEALMGRSYVDLWSGERARSVETAADLGKRFPANSDVQALQRAIDDSMSFWFRTTYDAIEDTDDNQLDTYRVEVGDAISPRVDYRLVLRRSDMTNPSSDAVIDRAAGQLSILPGGGHRFDFIVGSDRTEDTAGERDSEIVGSAVWAFGINRKTSGNVAIARETMIYSTKIADAGIGYDSISANLIQKFSRDMSVEVRGSIWSLTDDNERAGYDGAFRWTPRTGSVRWLAGVGYRAFSYDLNLDNGYFDPTDYSTYFALLGARGNFGSSDATWDLATEVGRQSFTLAGIDTDGDQTLSGILTLGFPVGDWVTIEVYAAHSDSAMQTATGFESDGYGVRLRVQQGR